VVKALKHFATFRKCFILHVTTVLVRRP